MSLSKRVGVAGVGVLFLGFGASASHAATDYKIVISRPEKVGQTYSIHSTGDSKQATTATLPGQPPHKQEQSFTGELEGTVKVLAVDKTSGKASKLQCTVSKLTRSGKSLLDAGTVVTIESKDTGPSVEANGAAVDKDAAAVLNLLIDTTKPGEPAEDDILGTDKPQAVGASWPIDADKAAASLAKAGLPLGKEDLHGTTKLVSVKNVAGKQAMQLQSDFADDKVSGPGPQGINVDSGTLAAHVDMLLPVDTTSHALSESRHLKMEMHASVQGVKVEVDMEQNATMKYGPATSK